MIALSFFLAGLMGVTLGMLGGGGSILTVPILRYVVGFDPKQAIALSLGVVGITSGIGALRYWHSGHARLPVAIPFGIVSMAASYGGAKISEHISGQTQLVLFALLMLVAAGSMFRERQAPTPEPAGAARDYRWTDTVLIGALGLAVGLLTGLVGIGGGFMILPALVLLVKLPMRDAAGTSLVIMTMNAAAGLMGYTNHVDVPWAFLTGFTAVSVGGIIVGTHLVHRIAPDMLRKSFALFLIVMGLLILYNNRAALAGTVAIRVGEEPRGVSMGAEPGDSLSRAATPGLSERGIR